MAGSSREERVLISYREPNQDNYEMIEIRDDRIAAVLSSYRHFSQLFLVQSSNMFVNNVEE